MDSKDNASNLKLTPWPLLHGILLCVMTLSICIGLGAYISYWVALPVAVSITVLFSHIANLVTGPFHSIRLTRRLLLTTILAFLFSITGAFSYATLYELLVARSSGARFLDAQVTTARSKLQTASAGVFGLVDSTKRLADYSYERYDFEKNTGGSCPAYFNSGKRVGPIATFRLNDSETGKQISAIADAVTKDFYNQFQSKTYLDTQDYSAALSAAKKINFAIQKYNALKNDASLAAIEMQLNDLKATKIEGNKDCGDTARSTLIESAIRSLQQIKNNDLIKEIRPGIDLEDKKSITSISLLRGITLVASIPPISIVSWLLDINTTFNDDPLMKSELKAKGALNYETLPLAVSALLELMIILTARLAHSSGPVAFAVVDTAAIGSIATKQGIGGISKRLLLNIIFRSKNQDRPSSAIEGADAQKPYSHISSDPKFAQREKDFALKLLPWVVDLDWGTYLVIPDILSKELDQHAAGVLVYEGLAKLVALNVPWDNLTVIDYALIRKAEERRYGDKYQNISFHIYELSVHFSQLLRLELLRSSTPASAH